MSIYKKGDLVRVREDLASMPDEVNNPLQAIFFGYDPPEEVFYPAEDSKNPDGDEVPFIGAMNRTKGLTAIIAGIKNTEHGTVYSLLFENGDPWDGEANIVYTASMLEAV